MTTFKTPRKDRAMQKPKTVAFPLKKMSTRFKHNQEFSKQNKQLVSVDVSGYRTRTDTLTATGNAKHGTHVHVGKSVNNLDTSYTHQSPATALTNRKRLTNKSISFFVEDDNVDFKHDNFAKTHKNMYMQKFNLQEMANQAFKIKLENERSMNCFNYICRAQIR